MKKFVGKLLSAALAMVLLLGVAVPVQAGEIPELATSYDFAMETRMVMDLDIQSESPIHPMTIQMMLDAFSGEGVLMATNGTFYTDNDGLAFTLFCEFSVTVNVPMLGNTSVTLRYWVDADITDLNDPTMLVVFELEMPMLLRFMLNAAVPQLGYQFFVVDMSEFMAEIIHELDTLVVYISLEEINEMIAYLVEAFEAVMIRSGIQNYATFSFDYDYGALENGYFGGFDFWLAISDGIDSLDFDFSAYGEITNINTAERPVLPVLRPGNYLDVVALLGAW